MKKKKRKAKNDKPAHSLCADGREFIFHISSHHRSFGHVTTCAEVFDVGTLHRGASEVRGGWQLHVSYLNTL